MNNTMELARNNQKSVIEVNDYSQRVNGLNQVGEEINNSYEVTEAANSSANTTY